jgi:hypothetical protein
MHNTEIQDQQDNNLIDVANEAALTALTKAASNTTVLQSLDGIKKFCVGVTLPHKINMLFL